MEVINYKINNLINVFNLPKGNKGPFLFSTYSGYDPTIITKKYVVTRSLYSNTILDYVLYEEKINEKN